MNRQIENESRTFPGIPNLGSAKTDCCQLRNSLKTVPLFWDENPSYFSGRFFVRSKRVLKIAYLSEGINCFLKTVKVWRKIVLFVCDHFSSTNICPHFSSYFETTKYICICVFVCFMWVLSLQQKQLYFNTSNLFDRDNNDTNCQNRMGDQMIFGPIQI